MVMRTEKELRQRAPLWLGCLLIINFILMSIDARDAATKQRMIRVWAQTIASPFQRLLSGVSGTGVGTFEYLANLRLAAAENTGLKQQVATMQTELHEARAARDENERLKGLLGLKEEKRYETIPARVIGRDPTAWFKAVFLNRGSRAGVELDMPVVTRDGIVGRVVAVGPWTAQVMLITDDRSAAGAVVGQLSSSGALGSVKGTNQSNLLEMSYVSTLEPVNQGDYVFTTGQDRIYPPGLAVGEVVKVTTGGATASHEIQVKPSARLESLNEVAVLQYHQPQRDDLNEALPNIDKRKK